MRIIFSLYQVRKYVYHDSDNLDSAFDAGGKVSIGLTATTIVSQWTWTATLLQSSTVASKVRGYCTVLYCYSVCVYVIDVYVMHICIYIIYISILHIYVYIVLYNHRGVQTPKPFKSMQNSPGPQSF